MFRIQNWILALNLVFSQTALVLAENKEILVGNSETTSASAQTYDPYLLTAELNDTITFVFQGKTNHTVTQTTFGDPCGSSATGFDSGLFSPGQNYTITITNTDPIWIRCSHFCTSGMVAAINVPDNSTTTTYGQFQSNAMNNSTSTNSLSSTSHGTSTAPPSSQTSVTRSGGSTIPVTSTSSTGSASSSRYTVGGTTLYGLLSVLSLALLA
ncbi:hypothetical protein DL93DRAFT_186057 [Clavulina sp. PMI_390]|nr:hypothetical protein DL93DRAFT_186057 [Clavulina sp. PMI_390]